MCIPVSHIFENRKLVDKELHLPCPSPYNCNIRWDPCMSCINRYYHLEKNTSMSINANHFTQQSLDHSCRFHWIPNNSQTCWLSKTMLSLTMLHGQLMLRSTAQNFLDRDGFCWWILSISAWFRHQSLSINLSIKLWLMIQNQSKTYILVHMEKKSERE